MSYYVIGVGGTGAKSVEALTHLLAAGMMPEQQGSREEVYVLFVDPDQSNGSLGRAQLTLKHYENCAALRLGKTDLFKTKLVSAKPNVWSPFHDETRPRLDHFFHYNIMRGNNEEAAHLFDVLYSDEEKQTTLEMGFRGHPSIGAAVFANGIIPLTKA